MNKLILTTLLVFTGCTTLPTSPAPGPAPSPTEVGVSWDGSAPDGAPAPVTSPQPAAIVNPRCSGYSWKDRGVGPKGYFWGLSLVLPRALARAGSPVGKALGSSTKDALVLYADDFKDLGVPLVTFQDRVKATYLLLTGLGMRESSGNYLEGWDTTANSVSSSTAEAGLFQASFNSIGADPVLKDLATEYTAHPERCLVDDFKTGSHVPTGKSASIVGAGQGADFQRFTKACPAFATEYAAVLLRVLGGSAGYAGPIRRHAAELKRECYQ